MFLVYQTVSFRSLEYFHLNIQLGIMTLQLGIMTSLTQRGLALQKKKSTVLPVRRGRQSFLFHRSRARRSAGHAFQLGGKL